MTFFLYCYHVPTCFRGYVVLLPEAQENNADTVYISWLLRFCFLGCAGFGHLLGHVAFVVLRKLLWRLVTDTQ